MHAGQRGESRLRIDKGLSQLFRQTTLSPRAWSQRVASCHVVGSMA